MSLIDAYPQLHDRTDVTGIDTHYFYVNAWAMRRLVSRRPARHVDVGSQTILASLLSSLIPVVFVDYRPLHAKLTGLKWVEGSIRELPFGDASIESMSCLHVAEHIGLGRYGDPLDPQGTRKAAQELARVLRRGGTCISVCRSADHAYVLTPTGSMRLKQFANLRTAAGRVFWSGRSRPIR